VVAGAVQPADCEYARLFQTCSDIKSALRKTVFDDLTLHVREHCTREQLESVHRLLPNLGRVELITHSTAQICELFRQIGLAEAEQWRCRCVLTMSKNSFAGVLRHPQRLDLDLPDPTQAAKHGVRRTAIDTGEGSADSASQRV
jgi:hypothetical protein